ncbi:MAG: urease accessory protein UreD [Planctomycetaceae bacterium]
MNLSPTQPTSQGCGTLEVEFIAGRTVVTRARAHSPLKWLLPQRKTQAAWAFSSTFGGGLVGGDRIEMQVGVREGASAVLATQSSTKVYRCLPETQCLQFLRANVERDALLVVAPDPVTCFAGASYEQQQIIRLAPEATLVYVDWLTSGRRARGESWAFSRYQTRLDIDFDGERLLTDSLLLDPGDGPLHSPYRMGQFHCCAVVVMCGPQSAEASAALLNEVGNRPIEPEQTVIDSVSPLKSGAIWRIAGQTTESVAQVLKNRLEFLKPILGDSPWGRKW